MTGDYRREYVDYAASRRRTILLAAALFCDVLTVAFLIRACAGAYLYFAGVAASLAVSIALRLLSLRFGRTWVYEFCRDGVTITLKYPHKSVKTLELWRGEFELCVNGDENCPKLAPDPCDCEFYMVKLSDGRKYALALNDYMLALVDALSSKE